MVKIILVLLVAIAVAVFLTRPPSSSKGYTVYGTDWCGYTTKQRDYLDEKYGSNSHKYVNCDKEDCKGIKSFPVTITPSGKKVMGFNKTI